MLQETQAKRKNIIGHRSEREEKLDCGDNEDKRTRTREHVGGGQEIWTAWKIWLVVTGDEIEEDLDTREREARVRRKIGQVATTKSNILGVKHVLLEQN